MRLVAPDPRDDPARADLAARIDRLASIEEIHQLASRYAMAIDQRDIDTLVELYVQDVPVGGGRTGRDALREVFFGAPLQAVGITILHVGNHVIDFDDADHARGSVYCRGEIQTGPTTWISQAIHYGDTYERRDGRWYFVRRRHELFYGVEVGQRPIGLAPADWPAHDTGKGTLPERWPSWRAFWAAAPGEGAEG